MAIDLAKRSMVNKNLRFRDKTFRPVLHMSVLCHFSPVSWIALKTHKGSTCVWKIIVKSSGPWSQHEFSIWNLRASHVLTGLLGPWGGNSWLEKEANGGKAELRTQSPSDTVWVLSTSSWWNVFSFSEPINSHFLKLPFHPFIYSLFVQKLFSMCLSAGHTAVNKVLTS